MKEMPNIEEIANRMITICKCIGLNTISEEEGFVQLFQVLSETVPQALSEMQVKYLASNFSVLLYPEDIKRFVDEEYLSHKVWQKGAKKKKYRFCRIDFIFECIYTILLSERTESIKLGAKKLENVVGLFYPDTTSPFCDEDPYR